MVLQGWPKMSDAIPVFSISPIVLQPAKKKTRPIAAGLLAFALNICHALRIRFIFISFVEECLNIVGYTKTEVNSVRVQDLQCGTNVRVRVFPCGSYVNFHGLARVAIQGLTWVNFRFLAETRVKFRFLVYPVNPGRPAWSMVQIREKLPMATAQATCVSAGE